MTILAQLFWLAVSLLESDYEHEFLLALRLTSRVLHRLPLDRPDARDKVGLWFLDFWNNRILEIRVKAVILLRKFLEIQGDQVYSYRGHSRFPSTVLTRK